MNKSLSKKYGAEEVRAGFAPAGIAAECEKLVKIPESLLKVA